MPHQGYLSCVILHCSLILTFFSNTEHITSIQESAENFQNFLIQPDASTFKKVIQDDHYLHEHNHSHLTEEEDYDPEPVFTFQKFAFMLHLTLHSLFRSEETVCVVAVLTMWSFTKTFQAKMADSMMPASEVCIKTFFHL